MDLSIRLALQQALHRRDLFNILIILNRSLPHPRHVTLVLHNCPDMEVQLPLETLLGTLSIHTDPRGATCSETVSFQFARSIILTDSPPSQWV